MTYHLDLIFLLNVLVNVCLLKLTALVLRRRITQMRLWVSSLYGAATVLLWPLGLEAPIESFIGQVILACTLIWIAFGWMSIWPLVQAALAFTGTSYMMAGLVYVIHQTVFLRHDLFNDTVTLLTIAGAVPFSFLIFKLYHTFAVQREITFQTTVPCKVKIQGYELSFTTLLDTGNQLREPLSGYPVMFVELEQLKHGDAKPLADAIEDWMTSGLPGELVRHPRLIPYRGVSDSDGQLYGLKPDYVSIFTRNKWRETEPVYVVFEERQISGTNEYHGICPSSII
ncbi:sigma-E processing peptidase SpoIIGA [Salsuginibacillus halophilus]|uniref:sigma-E processing peptidase SpoIIGA n=1 Tax=Salsuginibacillus halophilus TaxID=517424 RepID=UPI0015E76D29|nr:sigma-E processing peptidase SpoIIGA [Salsuginibacillus halophilus]